MSSGDAPLLRRSRDFPARIAAFLDIKAFLEKFGAEASLHPDDWLKLVLLAEELFTNTIHHGHAGESKAQVMVQVEAYEQHIRLIYQDCAPPYNPLSGAARADVQLPVDTRPVGGLGMLLTVKLAEHASYSFSGGHNRVDLLLARAHQARRQAK